MNNIQTRLYTLAAAAVVVFSTAAQAQDQSYSATLDRLNIRHQTIADGLPPVDLSDWPVDGASTGLQVVRLPGSDVGIPATQFPGVRFISTDQIRNTDVSQMRAGLYLVDLDYIPPDLPENLRSRGYRLNADGALLDDNGDPIVAFVSSEVYQAIQLPSGGSPMGFLPRLLRKVRNLIVPSADAAFPFPWACFSFSPWAVYHGGFHRWYEASTYTASYGLDGQGRCSWASPLTKIDYQYARAAIYGPGPGQSSWGFKVPNRYAYDKWDVGYFWPAHGIPFTYHAGVWADGWYSFSRTATLGW